MYRLRAQNLTLSKGMVQKKKIKRGISNGGKGISRDNFQFFAKDGQKANDHQWKLWVHKKVRALLCPSNLSCVSHGFFCYIKRRTTCTLKHKNPKIIMCYNMIMTHFFHSVSGWSRRCRPGGWHIRIRSIDFLLSASIF